MSKNLAKQYSLFTSKSISNTFVGVLGKAIEDPLRSIDDFLQSLGADIGSL